MVCLLRRNPTTIIIDAMKRNSNFLLREVAGTWVIVPVGEATAEFPGMITVNSTGAYLWELLENAQTIQTLTQALVERYEVDEEQALADVKVFIEPLLRVDAIVEEG